jgi:exopolyphosphatase/guanosine-5'-triphosphate,3'-diphosphate pyrophosphatase
VTRLAAVDLGTNSTRLLVAEVGAAGEDETWPMCTHGPEAEVERRYGFETRLLSGDEEAELTRRGVGAPGEQTLVLDVGGGSTELILGPSRTSIDVGSVRLTERFLASDPPLRDELDAAIAHVRSVLPPLAPRTAVGVAATVRQLETLLGEITPGALDAELARLAALPLAQRRRVAGLDPDRAPVIVAGALIVAEVLRSYRLPSIAHSVRDLLDGAVMELARRK